jgi:hypothetical protein
VDSDYLDGWQAPGPSKHRDQRKEIDKIKQESVMVTERSVKYDRDWEKSSFIWVLLSN